MVTIHSTVRELKSIVEPTKMRVRCYSYSCAQYEKRKLLSKGFEAQIEYVNGNWSVIYY